ncbi:MAG TPA: hypothetical protein VLX85_13420 [Stellaceae bacterium]|nr:hypothetical protein [Stellaceae bacterium]
MAMTDAGPGMRSLFLKERAERVAAYDRRWSTFVEAFASCAARGASLAQLVDRYDAVTGEYDGVVPSWLAGQLPQLDLGRFAGEPPPQRLAVMNGRYVAVPTAPTVDAFCDVIAGAIDPGVDCVVEFGSGLGINLARLRLRLPDAPRTFVACEPTDEGRRATELLFSADPQSRLETHAFDYAAADLGALRRFRKIVAFTVHSIEQMPVLGETFHRALLGTNLHRCFHVEPVGWQRFTNIAAAVLEVHRDARALMQLNQTYRFVVEDERLVSNAAAWSGCCGYNTDLLPLIAREVEAGEIRLTNVAYDVLGRNPFNPSTFVAWSPVRRDGAPLRPS